MKYVDPSGELDQEITSASEVATATNAAIWGNPITQTSLGTVGVVAGAAALGGAMAGDAIDEHFHPAIADALWGPDTTGTCFFNPKLEMGSRSPKNRNSKCKDACRLASLSYLAEAQRFCNSLPTAGKRWECRENIAKAVTNEQICIGWCDSEFPPKKKSWIH
jgi:hypothetical protein